MLVLGIDPGYAITGYGLVATRSGRLRPVAAGVVRTAPTIPFSLRLKRIHDDLSELIARYRPDCMVVEELFFSKNHTTVIGVAEARGVAIVAGANAGLDVYEYTPMQVKQAVSGYGGADKRQVQTMVATLLALPEAPKPDDATDALAVAICHAFCQNTGAHRAIGGHR